MADPLKLPPDDRVVLVVGPGACNDRSSRAPHHTDPQLPHVASMMMNLRVPTELRAPAPPDLEVMRGQARGLIQLDRHACVELVCPPVSHYRAQPVILDGTRKLDEARHGATARHVPKGLQPLPPGAHRGRRR
jgi:hypothetical protein